MNEEDMIVPTQSAANDQEQVVIAPMRGELEGALLENAESVEESEADSESNDDPSGGESNNDSDGADESGEVEEEKTSPTTVVSEPSRTTVTSDPGDEFVPKNDYSYEITLADNTTIKITKPEDIDQLPPDADFGTPANLMKAQAALNKMMVGLDTERREWEANKEKYTEQVAQQEQATKRVETMVAEVNYLEAKGKLPKVDPKYENANWNDPEVAKQPGVKERLDLFNYQQKENVDRAKLGLPAMSLLEAHLQMQYELQSNAEQEQRTKQNVIRKQRGAMVGGSSPSSVPNVPEGYLVGTPQDPRSINPYI